MLRKTTKNSNKVHVLPEVLLNNIVDDDIRRLLAPLDLYQKMLLIPKYKIRDKFITPNGFWANITCIISTCLYTMLFLYNTIFIQKAGDPSTFSYVRAGLWLNFTVFTIGVIINCLTCIYLSKFYVKLVLKIQESHRSLDGGGFQSFVKLNWVFCVFLMIYQIIEAISVEAIYFKEVTFITFLSQYPLTSNDFNIVMAIRLMNFINIKFELCLKEFKLYLEVTKSSYGRLRNELICKRMYHMYSCITKCFNLFKKCFQYAIMYHVAEMFFHTILTVQYLIDLNRLSPDRWNHRNDYFFMEGIVIIWLLKKVIFHTCLAMALEKFYMIQESVEDICSMVQARSAPDACNIICKNVRRLRTSEADKFKPCLLFLIDAKFPLRLISLISTYIIVLLQFGYL